MKFVVTLFLLLIFAGCDLLKKSEPLVVTELQKYQICQVDEECVYAQNGPCDCNNGGQATSINKANLADFQNQFKNVPCTKRGGTWCKDGVARCESNKCTWKMSPPKSSNSDPNPITPPPPPPSVK